MMKKEFVSEKRLRFGVDQDKAAEGKAINGKPMKTPALSTRGASLATAPATVASVASDYDIFLKFLATAPSKKKEVFKVEVGASGGIDKKDKAPAETKGAKRTSFAVSLPSNENKIKVFDDEDDEEQVEEEMSSNATIPTPISKEDGDEEKEETGRISESLSSETFEDSTDLDIPHPNFSDHYSLYSSSSFVKFRSGNVHIHNQPGSQIILEESVTELEGGGLADDYQVNITVKRSNNSSHVGYYILKAIYSGIAIFIGGFVFIFSVGLLLFLISDLAHQANDAFTSKILFPFFGTLLSVPVFFDGLTQIMALITGFVMDVFAGNPLLQLFGWGSVATNWVTFVAFIGVSVIALIGSLMARSQQVWQITLVTSFISVSTLFIVFATITVYLRVTSCLNLVQEFRRRKMSFSYKVKFVIVTSARSQLSGKKQDLYIYESDAYDLKEVSSMTSTDNSLPNNAQPIRYISRGQLYLRLTQLRILSRIFETLEVPQRRFTQDEINGNLTFFTKNSWSLEGTFCRLRNQSYVSVVGGEAAMTHQQVLSSTICYFLSVIMYVLLVAAILVWVQAPPVMIIVIISLYIVFWVRKMRRGAKISKKLSESVDHYEQLNTGDSNEKAHGLLHKWECYTITRPTMAFTVVYLIFQVLVFFIYPLTFLCASKNIAGALVFIGMAWMSFQKRLLDPAQVLEELGSFASLGKVMVQSESAGLLGSTNMQDWNYKARLYHIQNMSNDASRMIWSRALGSFMLLFVVVAVVAVAAAGGSESSNANDPWLTFPSTNTYFYKEPQSAANPMCRLDTTDPTSSIQYLADYVFLANIPYFKHETLQPLLDTWFGESEAIYNEGAQLEFREIHAEFSKSLASYELVTFPSDSSAAVVVRGTKTPFDYLADAKLWYSSALFQLFRGAIPFGGAFNPLIRFSVSALSLLETAIIKKVAYYPETTKFIEYLKDSGKYNNIVITGHSLGGGVAIISGAQTHTKAVGLSAPNTVLGRDTVTPKITLDDLEKYTFNIIPERDIFPVIGDNLNAENIKCRARVMDTFSLDGCHACGRSLCEILYICGTVARPVPCECVSMFEYPEPVEISGGEAKNFAQVCPIIVPP
mmetsp:Transcript_1720/g.3672  ORF Transcript_1720/g.3672 Transcript_1720/m.3672 type:complete len:1099 (+) Transcript_1720:92-3388(+)